MGDGYLWIKALHVVSVISWMAGLLYLPRLYVYHASLPAGSPAAETFKVMESKLLRLIMNPAMIVAWLSGLWLAWTLAAWTDGWLHAKLLLVVLLSAMHGIMARWRRQFAEDRNVHSHRFYRWMNEVPTILMIGIVVLVIVKPF